MKSPKEGLLDLDVDGTPVDPAGGSDRVQVAFLKPPWLQLMDLDPGPSGSGFHPQATQEGVVIRSLPENRRLVSNGSETC